MPAPTTLGDLRTSGYPDRSVKEELRANLLARLGGGTPLFGDIVGYDDSVVPALERALLAGHDVIMLGERGQAKSRLMRHLVDLLDGTIPAIEGCEVNDHPYRPICARCRALVVECGDRTPVVWIERDRRYAEKLATPDTSVADLIGDVDPIRVAEGRYLSDELTIHYGLVPRTNRGIVAINELPDLPERIQVGLFNILEEREIQIRGYTIRLPLDLLLICSANPEDYTHRGRIVSPLKDRFGSQVRTHYPERIIDEIAIMEQEATPPPEGVPVVVPSYMKEIVAELASRLRASPEVNQRSGVSVRFSIGAMEVVAASALRRAVRKSETAAVPRVVDLWAALPALMGRVEFETLEEGRELDILGRALKHATLEVYRRRIGGEDLSEVVAPFEEGLVVSTSDVTASSDFLAQLPQQAPPGLGRALSRLGLEDAGEAGTASALELCLEGLHLTRRLNKRAGTDGRWTFEATPA